MELQCLCLYILNPKIDIATCNFSKVVLFSSAEESISGAAILSILCDAEEEHSRCLDQMPYAGTCLGF